MINVLLTGVGGQGTVLAAKVLAQAAQEKGWQVRTAETIGMAQRGGNVTSHVRMGNDGEEVYAPLLARGTANVMCEMAPGCASIQALNRPIDISASNPCGPQPKAPTTSVSQPFSAAMRKSDSMRLASACSHSRSERWFSSARARMGSGMASTSARRMVPSRTNATSGR